LNQKERYNEELIQWLGSYKLLVTAGIL